MGDAGATAAVSAVDGQDGVAVGCDCSPLRLCRFAVFVCYDYFVGSFWMDVFEEFAKACDGSVLGGTIQKKAHAKLAKAAKERQRNYFSVELRIHSLESYF